MRTIKTYTHSDNIASLVPSELELGRRVFTINLGYQSEESILIITDPSMEKIEANFWFESAKSLSSNVVMMVFSGMNQNAQEPPHDISQKMLESDIVILQTPFSLTHTQARKAATDQDVRVASLPTVTKEIILRTLTIDYQPVAHLALEVASLLSQTQTAKLSSANGTNMVFSLVDRVGIEDTGLYIHPGDYGNLPAGEAFIAPQEGTANGVFVVDGSFADIPLDSPITITVEKGFATHITGGEAATSLNQKLHSLPQEARNIAELGIGTNPSANPTGTLIEAEKAFGTVHIALGNNATIGGVTNVAFHSDGVILNPTLILDDHTVLNDGEFQLS